MSMEGIRFIESTSMPEDTLIAFSEGGISCDWSKATVAFDGDRLTILVPIHYDMTKIAMLTGIAEQPPRRQE
ncbi:MAG: hypothetical protein LUO93_09575 [Methanomicrobiales archaeon]|nr:hypothetical protein [Methanomicrobiales archaeon]